MTNKKSIIRFTAFLLMLCMCACCFAGCTKSPEGTSVGTVQEELLSEYYVDGEVIDNTSEAGASETQNAASGSNGNSGSKGFRNS